MVPGRGHLKFLLIAITQDMFVVARNGFRCFTALAKFFQITLHFISNLKFYLTRFVTSSIMTSKFGILIHSHT